MTRFVTIFLVFTLLIACSPVRTRDYNKSKREQGLSDGVQSNSPSSKSTKSSSSKSSTIVRQEQAKQEKPIFRRFSDTTYVYLGEYKPPKSPVKAEAKQINSGLANAIKEFEDGNTSSACESISNILSGMSKDSEDYPETLFYTSECYLAKNKFDPAKKILIELLSGENLNDNVKEQSLVRLGQIFCIEGDAVSAERLFRQLRREFPKSIYLPIANCDAIEKK